MQNSKQIIRGVLNYSRHLYEHGFSFLAFLLAVFAFAFAGSTEEETRVSQSRALTFAEHTNVEQKIWRENESEWLTGQATSLTQKLKENGIYQATVYSRLKSDESALEKASRRGISMMELNDLYGMRIVVANELDVYRCLNLICETYPVVPGTMKNYILSPKASGYQSVHVVTQMDSRRVEFQLRTESMHLAAEAEHEAYKARMRAA